MITLRDVTLDDAARVRDIYAPFVREGAITFETEVPTVDEIAGRIRTTSATHPYLVAIDDDRVIAFAYAGAFRARAAYAWTCEVSVYVDDGHRQRGVARALYTALFRLLALQGFAQLVAVITLPNPASERFHGELGFVASGRIPRAGFKHGAWHDVGFSTRALSADGSAPAPPTPASTLRATPAWTAALARADEDG